MDFTCATCGLRFEFASRERKWTRAPSPSDEKSDFYWRQSTAKSLHATNMCSSFDQLN